MGDVVKFLLLGFVIGVGLFVYPGGPRALVDRVYAFVDADTATPQSSDVAQANTAASPAVQTAHVQSAPSSGGSLSRVRLKADGRGHFVTHIEINGRSTKAVVDTGASSVAIPESVARKAGLFLKPADFNRPVSTANGTTYAAPVSLRRVQVDGLSVRDVEGIVLPDASLSIVLLGMTFLGKLSTFSIEDGTLLLVR